MIMRTNNPCIDAALRLLDEIGIRGNDNVVVARGGRHPQIHFRINNNNVNVRHVFAVPGTSGDRRAPDNVRAQLRNYLREHGVEVREPAKSPVAPPPRKVDLITELTKRVAELERQVRELQEDRGQAFVSNAK